MPACLPRHHVAVLERRFLVCPFPCVFCHGEIFIYPISGFSALVNHGFSLCLTYFFPFRPFLNQLSITLPECRIWQCSKTGRS